MPKKTKSKKKSKHNYSKYITYTIVLFLLLSVVGAIGYYAGYEDAKEDTKILIYKERAQTKKLLEKLERASSKQSKKTKSLNKQLKKVLKQKKDEYKKTAQHEIDKPSKKLMQASTKTDRAAKSSYKKAKLAIIIDDVSFQRDIKNIKALHIPLTMSFLPPSKIHPQSHILASKESFYMVHLPMEAQSFTAEEPFTLRVTDSQAKILDRIEKVKKYFPKVKYINNHTGSKFTSDEVAMNRLIFALRRNNITFIDSRTTAQTKAPVVLKNYNLPYIARDVFLDHDPDINVIKKEIRRAVKVAKKKGSAIAIGHPHKNTLKALMESKEILKQVELVRIDKLLL